MRGCPCTAPPPAGEVCEAVRARPRDQQLTHVFRLQRQHTALVAEQHQRLPAPTPGGHQGVHKGSPGGPQGVTTRSRGGHVGVTWGSRGGHEGVTWTEA
eukprot:1195841-Prorocentrum_minimum.AAC.3